jgi:tartrate dehydrogenase/decarboxylase / D-malate dehydrogenase
MSERAQTFTIAKIPADGVGREVVEAGQRVLACVAGQSGGKLVFAWEEPNGSWF